MTTEQKIIKAKVGLLELARQLGNLSQASKLMGNSRDTFYRYRQAVDEGCSRAKATTASSPGALSAALRPRQVANP